MYVETEIIAFAVHVVMGRFLYAHPFYIGIYF